MTNVLTVKNIHKNFSDLEVLKGISFEVNKGDVIAILGSSGSGKTTLLRCINFLERADEGSIIFDNKEYDLKHIKKKEIANIRKKTSFVFQQFNLFRNKTALQNITEALVVGHKMNKEEAHKIALEVLDKVGLKDKANSYPSQLSGGQQQRVGIARAIATNPEIIYFDEPTSALDPELISEVLNTIKQLANEGKTMLIVTHELNFARKVANKVIFIDNGTIISNTNNVDFFENQTNERINNFINMINDKEKNI